MIEKLIILNKQVKSILNKEFKSGNLVLNQQESLKININLLELIKNNINTNILYNIRIFSSISSNIYYKYYNNLYIILVCDENENELAMIDFLNFYISLIQELFFFDEVSIENNIDNIHILSNEIIVGGVVCELNRNEIMKSYMDIVKQ